MSPTSPKLLDAALLVLLVCKLHAQLVAHQPEPQRCAALHPIRRPPARPQRLTIKPLLSERAVR
jgi:hypothetical protein